MSQSIPAQPAAPQTAIIFPKKLRLKILLIIVSTVILPLLIALIFKLTNPWMMIPIFLLVASLGVYLCWNLLKPLEEIYQGTLILTKGELKHRFNIHTGDEFELLGASLNRIAQVLDDTIQAISKDKDYIVSERNKLNTIISSITDGVIVLDLHRNVVLANTAAEKMLGLSIQDLAGKPLDELASFKNSNGLLATAKDYCQAPPVPGNPPIVTLTNQKGQEVQVKLTIAQIAEGLQADLGCIFILHDVTADKTFEQMQIDFVSMASHEFRTPLTSIIDYLSVISEEGKGKLGTELGGFLERALTSAQQLSALVDNILNVSKIERGSFSVALKPIDWKKKITQIVESSKLLATQKNISLQLKLPDESIPKVLADDVRINEVLNNLISNAINYTKEGGEIKVGVKVNSQEVTTYIEDSGKGIPAEALPHLFNKFYRVTGALEEGNKGSGLGLYISKSIMDLHHGKIWVDSKPGKGSTFYFSLPIGDGVPTHPTIVQLRSQKA